MPATLGLFTLVSATGAAMYLFPTPATSRSGLTYDRVVEKHYPNEYESVIGYHVGRTSVFSASVWGLCAAYLFVARGYFGASLCAVLDAAGAFLAQVPVVGPVVAPVLGDGAAPPADSWYGPHDPLLLSLFVLFSVQTALHCARVTSRTLPALRRVAGQHPLLCEIARFGPLRRVQADIDTEFREGWDVHPHNGAGAAERGPGDDRVPVEMFELQGTRAIVTRSWVIVAGAATVRVAHLRDVSMRVDPAATVRVQVSDDDARRAGRRRGEMVSVLRVVCTPSRRGARPFDLHVFETDWTRLVGRLQAVVVNAQEAVLSETMDSRFLDAFRDAVSRNTGTHASAGLTRTVDDSGAPVPDYGLGALAADGDDSRGAAGNRGAPEDAGRDSGDDSDGGEEIEACIGCLRRTPDVRLVRRCAADSACGACYCRPLWCCDCLARWFQSKQRENLRPPERWLLGRAPCPTCRASFCALDIVWMNAAAAATAAQGQGHGQGQGQEQGQGQGL